MLSNASDFDETKMSRLAMHAHGAPLILAGRPMNRRHRKDPKPPPPQQHNLKVIAADVANVTNVQATAALNGQCDTNTDDKEVSTSGGCLNANASNPDECGSSSSSSSSSSCPVQQSEMCLPRIIKPRKRRKKDRKPTNGVAATIPTAIPNATVTANMTGTQLSSSNASLTSPALVTTAVAKTEPDNLLMNTTSTVCFNLNQMLAAATNDQMVSNNSIHQQLNGVTDDFKPCYFELSQELSLDIGLKPELEQTFDDGIDVNDDSDAAGVHNTDGLTTCSCRLCDPYCRIWAFPLRRSCSDETDDRIRNRVKDVGVIGGNRAMQPRNEWRSTPQLQPATANGSCGLPNVSLDHRHQLQQLIQQQSNLLQEMTSPHTRKSSFSDSSNDSGCCSCCSCCCTCDLLGGSSSGGGNNAAGVFTDSIQEIQRQMQRVDLGGTTSSLFSTVEDTCNFRALDIDASNLTSCIELDRGNEVLNCLDMVWNHGVNNNLTT